MNAKLSLLKVTAALLSGLAVVYLVVTPQINWHIASLFWNTVAVALWLYILFNETLLQKK